MIGFAALTARHAAVRVAGLDEHAEPVRIEGRGWYARILQHEIDHLRGIVCCDRMEPRTLTTHDNHLRHWRSIMAVEVLLQRTWHSVRPDSDPWVIDGLGPWAEGLPRHLCRRPGAGLGRSIENYRIPDYLWGIT